MKPYIAYINQDSINLVKQGSCKHANKILQLEKQAFKLTDIMFPFNIMHLFKISKSIALVVILVFIAILVNYTHLTLHTYITFCVVFALFRCNLAGWMNKRKGYTRKLIIFSSNYKKAKLEALSKLFDDRRSYLIKKYH